MKRLLAVAASLCASVVACDDGPQSHVYVAMLYEPARACLDPSTTLAIIGTPNGSLECYRKCLVEDAPPAVGAELVYVSTMCPPYPAVITDATGTDPACQAALAAYDDGAVCGEDAGSDDVDGEAIDDGGPSDAELDGDVLVTPADASDAAEITDARSD
jgi:hypothetical protein